MTTAAATKPASLSNETKTILGYLIAEWEGAALSERDLDEKEAFNRPAWQLKKALAGTYEDVLKVIPICPGYPKGGRWVLQELAEAERDGKTVVIKEEGNGRSSWAIQ